MAIVNMSKDYIERLIEVAHAYYMDNQTQAQIASSLGMSRSMVSRDLMQARELGIVQIHIRDPRHTRPDLVSGLQAEYPSLEHAIVTPTFSGEPDAVRNMIGRFAANYIAEKVQPNQRIVLGCGRTLRAVVDALPQKSVPSVKIIQAMGNIGHEAHHIDYNAIAQLAADRLGGRAVYLSAPAILGDGTALSFANKNPSVRQSLDLASSADVYIVGLGSLESDQLYAQAGLIQSSELSYLQERAVGDICGRFFDGAGHAVPAPFEDRTVGITLADLLNPSLSIGVAAGVDKVDPIAGALRGGFLDVLVTDEETARGLLSLEESRNKEVSASL